MNGYDSEHNNTGNSRYSRRGNDGKLSNICDNVVASDHAKKTKLQKMSSIEHVTPKVWSHQPHKTSEKGQWRSVRPSYLKNQENYDKPKDNPTGEAKHNNPTGEAKNNASRFSSSFVSSFSHEKINKSEECVRINKPKNQGNCKSSDCSKSKTTKKVESASTISQRLLSENTNNNHRSEPHFRKNRPKDIVTGHEQKPRMGYRPSFSRDIKSPGFGTLRRIWDARANQTDAEPASANTNKQFTPSTWHNTRKSYTKRPETSIESLAANVDILSPKPFCSGSTDKGRKRYSFENVIATCSDRHKDSSRERQSTLQTDEKVTADESDSESDLFEEERSVLEDEETLSLVSSDDQVDVNPIANVRNDILSDLNDRLDNINIGVYGRIDDDESETEIDAIVYNSAEPDSNIVTKAELERDKVTPPVPLHDVDVSATQVVGAPTLSNDMQPDYLPMASQTPDPNERRYVDMTGKSSSVDEVEYDTFCVPPPQNQSKPKREYHEIDPNVPPPPTHKPPKLPLERKSTLESFDPPPLPPANPTGRRSEVSTRKKKNEILKSLQDTSSQQKSPSKGTKKLKYVEVEVLPSSTTSPLKSTKTTYTEVLVMSENERSQRSRSGSGISEDGLSNVSPKKHSVTKPILPALFSKKEPKSNQTKDSQENLTDFGKERSKKKRKSGRFFGKKNKKEVQSRSSHNSECEAGTSVSRENSSGTTSETSINRLSSNVPSSSSTTTSPNSSGDGEVGRLPTRDVIVTTEFKPTWKALSTSRNTDNKNAPHKPVPHPRTTGINQKPKTKSFSPTGRNSTFLAYPAAQTQRSSDSKDGNDNKPTEVTSFLHGKANSESNLTSNHRRSHPPVPRHRNTSLTPSETAVDAPSSVQDYNGPAVPIPLPDVTLPSSAVTSSENQEQESFYEAAGDPTLTPAVGIYNAAEEIADIGAPPPVPARDDDDDKIYETIVPPSPMTNDEPGYKFLEAEPLYQIYRTRTLTHASSKRKAAENAREKSKSEPVKSPEFKSGMLSDDLGTSTLWRSIPEVVMSGLADGMQPNELKLQQSQFEVITSQASYLRSLNILIQHFMHDQAMQSTEVLSQGDKRHLFSNIETVRQVEQKFLRDLENHFWKDIKLTKVCDLIAQYAKSDFDVYIRYIQNQVYQDRALTKLQRNHERFAEELCRLESSPGCNKLPLLSFLLLPMQRVTRLPLLMTAIVNAADSAGDQKICKKAKHALGVVNKLVKKCNDSARSMQQTEQLAEIASQLDYSSSVKMYALVSQSRSLVKKGEMNVSMITDAKKAAKTSKLWLFLFSDVLFIAKKKNLMDFGPTRYEVTDWANRQYLAVNESAVTETAIFLVILENQAGKRIEMTLMPMAQNELKRWETALNPPKYGSLGESIYESWDCPQYSCVEPYQAQQPDELSLDVGDVMQIYKKTADGWLEGERLRDGESGWFPKSFCEEIEDEHVRSRNMKNLYKSYAAA